MAQATQRDRDEAAHTLGGRIRSARRAMGLTLDELAARSGVSKPYLSLIETGRVANPPSDEKLGGIERGLEMPAGELVARAQLLRTPPKVREMLGALLKEKGGLDALHAEGGLRQLAEVAGNLSGDLAGGGVVDVPIINKVAAGYPTEYTDLGYPPRVADDYLPVPGLGDEDAFAARVVGDSMAPRYKAGDTIIFSPAAPPRDGDDCFVRLENGEVTFKRVFFEAPDSPDEPLIRLQPRNVSYRPTLVRRSEVAAMFRAVFRFERVDRP